jgi:hypothetical protein
MASNGQNAQQVGGVAFTVGNAYLWATIYYLDSVTDYREYIARDPVQPAQKPPETPPGIIVLIVSFLVVAMAFLFSLKST